MTNHSINKDVDRKSASTPEFLLYFNRIFKTQFIFSGWMNSIEKRRKEKKGKIERGQDMYWSSDQ